MCGYRPNSYQIYKSRWWGDCTFARASPVSLSRKPLSLDIEATPKTDRQTEKQTFIAKHGVLPVVIARIANQQIRLAHCRKL